MLALEHATHVSKGSWHVMVSMQEFSHYGQKEDKGGWSRLDTSRPNVAIVSSETAETLVESWYKVDSIKKYADYEEAGYHKA